MNILVLGGSPKGDQSVTIQYVKYLQKCFPEHQLEVAQISSRINALGKSELEFQKLMERIAAADGLLWAFPVYFLLVPSQYKRFVELVHERKAQKYFDGKYCGILTTSVHFLDHIAPRYIRAISEDLGMRCVGDYSAAMYDLLEEKEQQRLETFGHVFFDALAEKRPLSRQSRPLKAPSLRYLPGSVRPVADQGDRKVLVLTDVRPGQTNLEKMLETLRACFARPVEVVNLNDVRIRSGCVGCIRCGYDNTCLFKDQDDFVDFFETKVKTADILFFTGAMQDRYLSSRWKLFLDRSFYNNHIPSLVGKHVGIIISGPLSQEPNLREALAGYLGMHHANLIDVVSDDASSSAEIDADLASLAQRCVSFAERKYVPPPDFLKFGGGKVFRDMLWGGFYVPFQADHRFYKDKGIYDFPREPAVQRVMNHIIAALNRVPMFRREFHKRLKSEIIRPFKKVVE